MRVIALDLGGTKLAGAVVNRRGQVLHRQEVALAGRTGGAVGGLIRRLLRALEDVVRTEGEELFGVGIAVPGISNQRTGRVWAPNIPGWTRYPLRSEVRSALRRRPVVVEMESDRICYILGEQWRGAARGCRNAIYLAVGTGIGAGILCDGRVLRGAAGIAGSIGWMALDRPFQPQYRIHGCFEAHASGPGLARVASQLRKKQGRTPRGGTQAPGFESAQEVFAAWEKGDPAARRAIEQAVEFWGMGVANLVSLFNPERIVFGGGVFGPGLRLLQRIQTEAARWAQPVAMRQVEWVGSALGGDAGLLGAARLAWQSSNPFV
mgnify:FL=1